MVGMAPTIAFGLGWGVRLNLLLLLTVVDTSAVGEGVLTSWKAQLLDTLYKKSYSVLLGTHTSVSDKDYLESMHTKIQQEYNEKFGIDTVSYFLKHATVQYLSSCSEQLLMWQLQYIIPLSYGDRCIEFYYDRENSYTECLFCMQEYPSLISDITGTITLLGGTIIDGSYHNLDHIGSIYRFKVQSVAGVIFQPIKEKFMEVLDSVTLKKKNILSLLKQRQGVLVQKKDIFDVELSVRFHNSASYIFTIVEIQAKDNLGLLYKICNVFETMGLKVGHVKISTYGESALDVFYLKNKYGLKILKLSDQRRIHKIIKEALQ